MTGMSSMSSGHVTAMTRKAWQVEFPHKRYAVVVARTERAAKRVAEERYGRSCGKAKGVVEVGE